MLRLSLYSRAVDSNELYKLLSITVRRELVKCEKHVKVPRGAKLMSHGEIPENVIIIEQGSAEICLPAGEKEVHLAFAGPGKVLGLQTIVAGVSPEVDVTSLEPCTLALIPLNEFRTLLKHHPAISRAISRILSTDLKAAENVLR